MTFEEALRVELIKITELNNKVFPLNAKEGTEAPYLVYVSSEGQYDKSLGGFHNTKEVSVELNILHSKYSSMKALSKKVMDKLKTFEKRHLGETGPFIQELVFENDGVELYEAQVDLYRKKIDIRVYFEEV